jgi:soluble lytic murein transglycosylase-like protein
MSPNGNSTGILILALGGLAALLMSQRSQSADVDAGAIAPTYPELGQSFDELGTQPGYEYATDTSTAALDDAAAVFGPALDTWGSTFLDTSSGADFRVGEFPTWAQLIASTEAAQGIPQDVLARLLWKESRYRADIINGTTQSPVGAAGIAQFMPDTATQYGLMTGGIDGRLDPKRAIPAAGRYVKALYGMFKPSWVNAIAAYNWGPGNMRHYLAGDIDHRTGRPYVMPGETQDYIAYITPASVFV